jgi:hypothetical protein
MEEMVQLLLRDQIDQSRSVLVNYVLSSNQ